MRDLFARMPWFAGVPLVAVGAAAVAAFSFVFTSDLFNEECLNERNRLTGEFEASNCGEGARLAAATQEPSPSSTDVPMSTSAPSKSPTSAPSEAPEGATPTGTSEATPEATPESEPEAPQTGVLLRGEFQDGDPGHDGSGIAEIQRLPDGTLNLFLSNFSVTNGPDLFVVLSRDAGGSYTEGDLVLEGLKANNGNQNYAIPADTDLSQFKTVIIWCRSFDVDFSFAILGGTQ
jgi:hypothetical protein